MLVNCERFFYILTRIGYQLTFKRLLASRAARALAGGSASCDRFAARAFALGQPVLEVVAGVRLRLDPDGHHDEGFEGQVHRAKLG